MKPENVFSKLRAKQTNVNRPSVNLYNFIALGLSVVVCVVSVHMRATLALLCVCMAC